MSGPAHQPLPSRSGLPQVPCCTAEAVCRPARQRVRCMSGTVCPVAHPPSPPRPWCRGQRARATCLPHWQRGGARQHAALARLAASPGPQNSARPRRALAGCRASAAAAVCCGRCCRGSRRGRWRTHSRRGGRGGRGSSRHRQCAACGRRGSPWTCSSRGGGSAQRDIACSLWWWRVRR